MRDIWYLVLLLIISALITPSVKQYGYRLDAFAQLDVRLDKTFYFRRCMLGFYIDLQTATVSKLRQPDVLLSTRIVEKPEAPLP